MDAIVNDLATEGFRIVGRVWHHGDVLTTSDDVRDAVVRAFQRHGERPTPGAVRNAMAALPRVSGNAPVRPAILDAPDSELGIQAPTADELAAEAAWFVDLFFAFSLTFPRDTPWLFDNDNMACDVTPADIRRTAFRAGMAVAAAHGVPDSPPTMRQVVNALIKRMAADGRLSN